MDGPGTDSPLTFLTIYLGRRCILSLSVYLSASSKVCLSVYLSVSSKVFVYLSVPLFEGLSVCPSLRRSVCLPIYPPLRKSVCLPIYLPLRRSVYLSICPSPRNVWSFSSYSKSSFQFFFTAIFLPSCRWALRLTGVTKAQVVHRSEPRVTLLPVLH